MLFDIVWEELEELEIIILLSRKDPYNYGVLVYRFKPVNMILSNKRYE